MATRRLSGANYSALVNIAKNIVLDELKQDVRRDLPAAGKLEALH